MAGELAGVAPSILAADFARLGEQVGEVLEAGAVVVIDPVLPQSLAMAPAAPDRSGDSG